MRQRMILSGLAMGTLLAVLPATGLAQNHRGRSEGGHSYASRGSSGYSRGPSFSSGRSFGGHSFVAPRGGEPRHEYSRGRSYYVAPRIYSRPVYRGYYRGGVYLGFGPSYGYAYDPGYAYAPAPGYSYDPNYSYNSGPVTQGCEGSYDQSGNWIPNPNCATGQGQYPPPQQNYDPNQQQYPQSQPGYDPNQPQYPQTQQGYDPNQPRYPQPQQNYDPNQQYPPRQQNYVPNQAPRYNR
jgi:hypothetical protein